METIAYHDTPISNDLPSPSELFFNRKINTRLGLMYQATSLTDKQKTKLMERRAAHLTPSEPRKAYLPNQQVWFTEDGNAEWRPGFIESRDQHPDSYWLISADNYRRLRRNKRDIKPRLPAITLQLPPALPANADRPIFPHQPPDTIGEEPAEPQEEPRIAVLLKPDHPDTVLSPQKDECDADTRPPMMSESQSKPRSSGRKHKPKRDPSFVYH